MPYINATFLAIVALLAMSSSVNAAQINSKDFPWVQTVADSGIKSLQICGSSKIVPARKPIQRHFFVGPESTGYFATGLPTIESYFQILTDFRLAEAKAEMAKALSNAQLWTITKEQTVPRSLGKPTNIELPFTATVKDCVEGAKTTLGNNCSSSSGKNLVSCCREKFIGPIIIWGEKSDHRMYFSPDPSVSLKVPGEATHRYCNVSDPMKIKTN